MDTIPYLKQPVLCKHRRMTTDTNYGCLPKASLVNMMASRPNATQDRSRRTDEDIRPQDEGSLSEDKAAPRVDPLRSKHPQRQSTSLG